MGATPKNDHRYNPTHHGSYWLKLSPKQDNHKGVLLQTPVTTKRVVCPTSPSPPGQMSDQTPQPPPYPPSVLPQRAYHPPVGSLHRMTLY